VKAPLIDRLLAEGWFDTAQEALPWLMAGKVLADTRQVFNAQEKIPAATPIRVKEYYKRYYVNKGGLKLHKALTDFGIAVADEVVLDCGASTGGFTDCLLQHGATKVYAVDAGHGELAAKLRQDPRVVNLERTNIADSALHTLTPAPTLITLDLSYLSLKDALPHCKTILRGTGTIIALIKPIVEVNSSEIRRTGHINQPEVLQAVLQDMAAFFAASGLALCGMTVSPIRGNKDAIEFFAHLQLHAATDVFINFDALIAESLTLDKFDKNSYTPKKFFL